MDLLVTRPRRSPAGRGSSLPLRWLPGSLGQRSLKRNVILNWAVSFIGAVVSLLVTPLVVRTLDTELYGVWTFLNGLTLYTNLLYFGLGASVMKGLSEASGRENAVGQTRLLGMALTIYAGLGTLCLVAAVLLSPVVPRLLARPLPPDLEHAASLTLVLLGIRLLFMFVNSAMSALVASQGRSDLVSAVMILVAVVRAAATIVVMQLPSPLVWLAALMAADAIVQLPLLVLCGKIVAPEVKLRPVLPTRPELASLYGFGAQAFVVQVSVLVIAYTDTALIGVILGAAAVTLYTLPLQLIEYSRVLVSGITQSLLPELAALRARGDMAGMRAIFFTAARMSATLALFVNVHLVLLGPAFLRLWVGPEIAEGSLRILACLAIAATASAVSLQVLLPYYQALDRMRVLAAIVIVEAVVNLALSVWLSQTLGVWGVALATAVPAVAVTFVLAPSRILPAIGVGLPEALRRIAAPALAVGAVSGLVQLAIGPWLPVTSFAVLAARAAVSVAAAGLTVLVAFPREGWMPIVARLAPGLARRLA